MKKVNCKNNEYGANVYILGHKCYRCGHCWRPIDMEKIPKVCPKCKSPYWDRPKEKK
jgi:predicted Zn-ribbon and HTH transcriptional regulator